MPAKPTVCDECGALIEKGSELLHARWHGEQIAAPRYPYVIVQPAPLPTMPSYQEEWFCTDNPRYTNFPASTITWIDTGDLIGRHGRTTA